VENGSNAYDLVNAIDKHGSTALIHCAWGGYLDAVKVLITYRADVNARNIRKNSALHFSYERGHIALTSLLLLHGGATSLLYQNTLGKTPRDLIPPTSHPSIFKKRTYSAQSGSSLFSSEVRELQEKVKLYHKKHSSRKAFKTYRTNAKLHPEKQELHLLSSACALTPDCGNERRKSPFRSRAIRKSAWVSLRNGRATLGKMATLTSSKH